MLADKSKYSVIISGSRGLLGSAFVDYCRENNIKYQTFLPFPCSLESLKNRLKDGDITHFLNCCGWSNDFTSKDNPYEVFQSNSLCVLNQLESIRKFSPRTKYFNFGSIYEKTKKTPYAYSKITARNLIHSYIENHGLHCWMPYLSFTEYTKADSERFLPKIIRGIIERRKKYLNGEPFENLTLYNPDEIFHFCWATDICRAVFMLPDNANSDLALIEHRGNSLKNIVWHIEHLLSIDYENPNFFESNFSVVCFENKDKKEILELNLDNLDNFFDTWHGYEILPRVDICQILSNLIETETEKNPEAVAKKEKEIMAFRLKTKERETTREIYGKPT